MHHCSCGLLCHTSVICLWIGSLANAECGCADRAMVNCKSQMRTKIFGGKMRNDVSTIFIVLLSRMGHRTSMQTFVCIEIQILHVAWPADPHFTCGHRIGFGANACVVFYHPSGICRHQWPVTYWILCWNWQKGIQYSEVIMQNYIWKWGAQCWAKKIEASKWQSGNSNTSFGRH